MTIVWEKPLEVREPPEAFTPVVLSQAELPLNSSCRPLSFSQHKARVERPPAPGFSWTQYHAGLVAMTTVPKAKLGFGWVSPSSLAARAFVTSLFSKSQPPSLETAFSSDSSYGTFFHVPSILFFILSAELFIDTTYARELRGPQTTLAVLGNRGAVPGAASGILEY